MIKPMDNYNIFDTPTSVYKLNGYSLQELLSQFYKHIQDVINGVNNNEIDIKNFKEEVRKRLEEQDIKLDEMNEWLRGEGLQDEVIKQLNDMYDDGRLGDLINDVLLGEINNKVDNVNTKVNELELELSEFKTLTNTEITAINDNIVNLKNKLDNSSVSNPLDFGAKGDGITDDTMALRNAIENARISKKPVLIPNGVFLTDTLDIPNEVRIFGYGKGSKLKSLPTSNVLINIPFESKRITISSLYLDGSGVATCIKTNTVPSTKLPSRHIFDNLHIFNPLIGMDMYDIGNFIQNVDIEGGVIKTGAIGLRINTSCTDNYVSNLKSYQMDIGIKIEGSSNFFTNCKTLVNRRGLMVGDIGKTVWNFICTNFSSQENTQQNIVIERMRNSKIEGVSEGSGVGTNGFDENGVPISNIHLKNCIFSTIDLNSKIQSPQGAEIYGVYIDENVKQNQIKFNYGCEKNIQRFTPIYSLFPNINKIEVNGMDYNNGFYYKFDDELKESLFESNNSYTTMRLISKNIIELTIDVTSAKQANRTQFGFSVKSTKFGLGGINFVIKNTYKDDGVRIGCQGQIVGDTSVSNVVEWYDGVGFSNYVYGARVIPSSTPPVNPTESRFNFIVDFANYEGSELKMQLLNVNHAFYYRQ